MIIIPVNLKEQFEISFKNYYNSFKNLDPKNSNPDEIITESETDNFSALLDGHTITCYNANQYINNYQKRMEDILDRRESNSSISFIRENENAYCHIKTYSFISAIAALGELSVNMRLYFALNTNNQTTIAIVGEDASGSALIPKDGMGFYVYENFGGGGTIDSSSNDLDCK